MKSLIWSIALVVYSFTMPARAITNGTNDDGTFQSVGVIVAYMPNGNVGVLCSGFLVASRVLLTAGHCTQTINDWITIGRISLEDVKVSFDNDDGRRIESHLDVTQLVTHPYFNHTFADRADLGAVVLAVPAEGQLVELPALGLLDSLALRTGNEGETFTVVGYGTDTEWPSTNLGRLSNGSRRVAHSEFLNLRAPWLHLSQNPILGNGGTCINDSGGPVFWYDEVGSPIAVSMTIWGDSLCASTGTTYRLDTALALDFIQAMSLEYP